MTDTTATAPLSDDDRMWLSRWRVGKQTGEEWLNSKPPAGQAHAILVKMLDRGGTNTVFARLLGEYLGVDPVKVYAENYPRKAAKLAAAARARGDHPHADQLHRARRLDGLRKLRPPAGRPAVDRPGHRPGLLGVIDPGWRARIDARLACAAEGALF